MGEVVVALKFKEEELQRPQKHSEDWLPQVYAPPSSLSPQPLLPHALPHCPVFSASQLVSLLLRMLYPTLPPLLPLSHYVPSSIHLFTEHLLCLALFCAGENKSQVRTRPIPKLMVWGHTVIKLAITI